MFLSLTTTHHPATDLGFLLMKHPDRVHAVDLSFGNAVVFFPEANAARCEAVLVLDVDPIALVRGRGTSAGLVDQYVNDRPYAASSFLSVALNAVFRTAMAGSSRERPDLAASAIPLEIAIRPLPVRGHDDLVTRLFEPLGWHVTLERIPGATGPSPYGALTLRGTMRLADALTQLYVLIPVLDEDKHYWVGDDEVDKLLAKGARWLEAHPERASIAARYLKGRRDLTRAALARLAPEADAAGETVALGEAGDETAAPALRLHDLRLETVRAALLEAGAVSVADLGCGEGKLLARLVRDKRFTRIVGLDPSTRALDRASDRLKLGAVGGPAEGRVTLLHGALTYVDERWHGFDAAALVEVIEHIDPERLPMVSEVIFAVARPRIVVVTTPNADYNARIPALAAGERRHADHRFEWTRAAFRAWVTSIEALYGYAAVLSEIGEPDTTFGGPSQMAVFTR